MNIERYESRYLGGENALKPLLEKEKILRYKTCLILDLDGVVYHGSQPIAGAVEAIAKFRASEKKIVFLTNNSASSSLKIVKKLLNFGINCAPEDLMTSSQASAIFIKEQKLDSGRGVFIVGTEALREELMTQGISCAEPGSCGAVLVGLDPNFSYSTIAQALTALNRGVPFIACNRDANFPTEGGRLMPGCGAMVGALEGASGRKVDFEIGKPHTVMLDLFRQRLQVAANDCLMVGDVLNSDILMANRSQIASVWIANDGARDASWVQPNLRVASLIELAELL